MNGNTKETYKYSVLELYASNLEGLEQFRDGFAIWLGINGGSGGWALDGSEVGESWCSMVDDSHGRR